MSATSHNPVTVRTCWAILRAAVYAACAVTVVGAGHTAGQEQFRIENRVFVDDEEEPQVKSTTIFYAGAVYDYLEAPAEVTVFDQAHGRFVLLDLTRRVKTELTTEQVATFVEHLKEWAKNQADPYLRFLADPEFDEQFDETAGELAFTSPWLTYRLTTVDAESEEISKQYREFSDWYCQLNTMINVGARPPFARMIVNRALEDRQQFAREVHLTLRPEEGFLPKRITIRSEHRLIRRLVQSDRDRVAQTDQFMAIFKPVSFVEYQETMSR